MLSRGQPQPTLTPDTNDFCVHCRGPLPQPHRRTRRYCKPSCRTLASKVRTTHAMAHTRDEASQVLHAGVNDFESELPLLRGARETLEDASAALAELARRFEAAELRLCRALERARSNLSHQDELQRDLVLARGQVAELQAETIRMRQALAERDTALARRLLEDPTPAQLPDKHVTFDIAEAERTAGAAAQSLPTASKACMHEDPVAPTVPPQEAAVPLPPQVAPSVPSAPTSPAVSMPAPSGTSPAQPTDPLPSAPADAQQKISTTAEAEQRRRDKYDLFGPMIRKKNKKWWEP